MLALYRLLAKEFNTKTVELCEHSFKRSDGDPVLSKSQETK